MPVDGSDSAVLPDLAALPEPASSYAPLDVSIALGRLLKTARQKSKLTEDARAELYTEALQLAKRYPDSVDSVAWQLEQMNLALPKLPRIA